MVSLEDTLRTLNIKDVPEYSLSGNTYIGKIVDIYDGDTCKIILLQNEKFIRYTCRLLGIDTPEIKTKSDMAFQARNRLIQLATNSNIELDNKMSHSQITKLLTNNTKLVKVQCYEFDKYGRLLIKIFNCDDASCSSDFNKILIDEKLANSYDGGTKSTFENS